MVRARFLASSLWCPARSIQTSERHTIRNSRRCARNATTIASPSRSPMSTSLSLSGNRRVIRTSADVMLGVSARSPREPVDGLLVEALHQRDQQLDRALEVATID